MKTFDHTVQATSGSAAAVTRSTPAGTGITWPAGTTTRSAYPPPASSAHTSSPTAQPVTPVAERRDGAAALHPDDLGGAGRRRVEALPLQQVGAVDRGGGDRERDLARARLGVGQLGDGQDVGATGPGGDDGAHAGHPRTAVGRGPSAQSSKASAVWSTVLSSGTSSSTSSGSGASAGRSHPSASRCARAASASISSGSAPR